MKKHLPKRILIALEEGFATEAANRIVDYFDRRSDFSLVSQERQGGFDGERRYVFIHDSCNLTAVCHYPSYGNEHSAGNAFCVTLYESTREPASDEEIITPRVKEDLEGIFNEVRYSTTAPNPLESHRPRKT